MRVKQSRSYPLPLTGQVHEDGNGWRSGRAGERRQALVQTIDLAPTLLDFFGLPATEDMQGTALTETVRSDRQVREAGLFGIFGGHVNVTDGRWVYLRAPAEAGNSPLVEYTLMPTLMRGRMPVSESLPHQWYDTPNVHYTTIRDFRLLVAEAGLAVEHEVAFRVRDGAASQVRFAPNLRAEIAVTVLSRTCQPGPPGPSVTRP